MSTPPLERTLEGVAEYLQGEQEADDERAGKEHADALDERRQQSPPDEVYEQDARRSVQRQAKRGAVANGRAGATPSASAASPAPLDWSALEGHTPPPRTWLVQDWLGADPTLCSGAGGTHKSRLWQTLGTALAIGREFLAATCTPLRVLMWACEDDADELWRRQAAICAHFGVPVSPSALKGFTLVPRRGAENTLFDLAYGKPDFTPTFALLREQVNDLKADVLVLDNNAQTFGGNESDRHQVTRYVNGVQGTVTGRPFASVFLGHVSRANAEFSGSLAWENATRMRWFVGTRLPDQQPDEDEPENPDVVYLARRKANYTAKDWRRLRFQNGLLLLEQPEGPRFDQTHQSDLAERLVLKAMPKLIEAGIKPTDGPTSPDYLPRQILNKGYAEGHGKKELAAAMHRLMGTGRLKRVEVGQYSNRRPRFGLWVVTP